MEKFCKWLCKKKRVKPFIFKDDGEWYFNLDMDDKICLFTMYKGNFWFNNKIPKQMLIGYMREYLFEAKGWRNVKAIYGDLKAEIEEDTCKNTY